MKKPDLISIIIPTYNQPQMLKQTLFSLNEQTDKYFDVIICDDGSHTQARHEIEKIKQKLSFCCTYYWQKDDGFRAAKARNEGIKRARGNYVIFTDGDCILPPQFVAQHRKLARKNCFVDGNRILLSQSLTNKIHKTQIQFSMRVSSLIKYKLTRKINKLSSFMRIPLGVCRDLKPKRWKGVKTCNLAVWKQDLIDINGFDESFQGWGHEDADLVIRLIKKGVKRRSGRYASVVFHQWHKINDRGNEKSNKAALMKSINSANLKTNNGLEKRQRV